MPNDFVKSRRGAVPADGGNRALATLGDLCAFDGTIASACALGIGIDDFLEMVQLARTSDSRAA